MPVIHTHVSVSTTPGQREALKAAYGKAITAVPGKSEGWLMCPFEDNMPIYFGGDDSKPAAYVEVNVFGRSVPGSAWEKLTEQIMAALGGPQAALERQVHAYTLRQQRYPLLLAQPPEALLASDAELLLLDVANEVDMLLSLEVATSGRQDLLPAPVLALALHTCERAGAPGLGQTLQAQRQSLADTPEADRMRLQIHPHPGSFRLQPQGTVAMAGPLVLPVLEPKPLAPAAARDKTA